MSIKRAVNDEITHGTGYLVLQASQPAHNLLRTSPNGLALVETLSTIIRPK